LKTGRPTLPSSAGIDRCLPWRHACSWLGSMPRFTTRKPAQLKLSRAHQAAWPSRDTLRWPRPELKTSQPSRDPLHVGPGGTRPAPAQPDHRSGSPAGTPRTGPDRERGELAQSGAKRPGLAGTCCCAGAPTQPGPKAPRTGRERANPA
jgi:hypothetical protein